MHFRKLIKNFLRFLIRILSFIPAIIMMYIIFSFSAQNGVESSNLSYRVSHDIVSTVDYAFNLELTEPQISRCISQIHFYIRKSAHFSEYLLLAVFIAIPLYVYDVRGMRLVIITEILCAGFAGLDEFHQLFVEGRGASVRDVLIDSSGALLGILIARILGYTFRKTIVKR